jgi:hypothetical protein
MIRPEYTAQMGLALTSRQDSWDSLLRVGEAAAALAPLSVRGADRGAAWRAQDGRQPATRPLRSPLDDEAAAYRAARRCWSLVGFSSWSAISRSCTVHLLLAKLASRAIGCWLLRLGRFLAGPGAGYAGVGVAAGVVDPAAYGSCDGSF